MINPSLNDQRTGWNDLGESRSLLMKDSIWERTCGITAAKVLNG